MRAALYAKFSTDKQASIEDQLRVCHRIADLHGFEPIALFEYAAIKLYIAKLFGADTLDGPVDVVDRQALKEGLRESILHDAINAF